MPAEPRRDGAADMPLDATREGPGGPAPLESTIWRPFGKGLLREPLSQGRRRLDSAAGKRDEFEVGMAALVGGIGRRSHGR